MNRSRLAPFVVALLCISAIGVAATTLESSLTTEPDDEIDIDYDQLPIGAGDAVALQEEMEGSQEDGDDIDEEAGTDGEEDSEEPPPEGSDDMDDGGGGEDLSEDEGTGESPTPPTLLDRLLALLAAVVRVLVLLGTMVALAVLAYRYRERILAMLGFDSTAEEATDTDDTDTPWPRTEPSNPVDRAWLWVARRANPERPETKTPAECAASAREAGLDPTAVDAITDAFERVHYGGVSVDSEADRAREALDRLRDDDQPQPDGDGRPRSHHGGDD